LRQEPDGEELIDRYYSIAPVIVRNIERLPGKGEIYEGIWSEYLSICFSLIEKGFYKKVKEVYIKMVEKMMSTYGIK